MKRNTTTDGTENTDKKSMYTLRFFIRFIGVIRGKKCTSWHWWAVIAPCLLTGVIVAQEALPNEIAMAIDKAGRSSDKDKIESFQKVVELADRTPLAVQERRELTSQFVKAVKDRRLTMDQMEKILVAKAKKQVARQIAYRRS